MLQNNLTRLRKNRPFRPQIQYKNIDLLIKANKDKETMI